MSMGVTLPVTTTTCDFCTKKCAQYLAEMWSSTQQMGMETTSSSVVQCKVPTPRWILVSQVRQCALLWYVTVDFGITVNSDSVD